MQIQEKNERKNNQGITLIALVITVIVLLILAGVTITMLTGQNGILTNATNAKIQTEIATLKEQVEMELWSVYVDSLAKEKSLTISEQVDKLKEKGIINEDMTFEKNDDYRLTYNGYIKDINEKIVNYVNFYADEDSLEVDRQGYECTAKVRVKNGKIKFGEDNDRNKYIIVANEAPDGYRFVYWIDQNDSIILFNNETISSTIRDMLYIPIYVRQETEVNMPKVALTVYSAIPENENKLYFTVKTDISDYYSSKYEHNNIGLLATNSLEYANESYMTIEKEQDTSNPSKLFYKKLSAASNKMLSYNWTKSNVGTDIWYVRGYTTIKNLETGETETIYTSIISAHR